MNDFIFTKMERVLTIILLFTIFLSSCQNKTENENQKEALDSTKTASVGKIEQIDPSLREILTADAVVEVISEGHVWSEGPVWVESHQMLLFSDVPLNKIYRWTAENGTEEYLHPSGYTGDHPETYSEPGSNGLLIHDGKLVLCQHGDRRVSIMDAPLEKPESKFITLIDGYKGKKLNSPNDAIFDSNGNLYVTDPPYGLPKQIDDPTKETDWQGVYKRTPDGKVTLLVDSLTRPNGIGLTPNEKTLIVANSDETKAVWYAFDFTEKGLLTHARIFHDATASVTPKNGLPDGLKVDANGNLFATGPGGVWIFNPEGKLLGKIKLENPCSNVALADSGKTLFVTNDMYILRIKMR